MSGMDNKTTNKIADHPLQTWEWGEFRARWGNEVLRTKHGTLTFHKMPFSKYKIGMLIRGKKPTSRMLSDLKKTGKENNLIFIKLEPNSPTKEVDQEKSAIEKTKKILKENGCVPGKTLFTPTSFWIDLTKSEDDLMKSFSSKTRYNIRLAERKGVKISEDNSDKAFNRYLELTKETVERQGFYAHSARYHTLMWEHLNTQMVKAKKEPIARLLTAKYKGEIITTWILFVWKNFLYYPYGASSVNHKNVMANNLMMWEAIRLGKNLKTKTFDLWGREPGKGFTKFKEGYKPKVVEFVGTWDLVINKPFYYTYKIAEGMRWPILRLRAKFTNPRF